MSDCLASQKNTDGKWLLQVLSPTPTPHSWAESKLAWGCSAPAWATCLSEQLQGWILPSFFRCWTALGGECLLPYQQTWESSLGLRGGLVVIEASKSNIHEFSNGRSQIYPRYRQTGQALCAILWGEPRWQGLWVSFPYTRTSKKKKIVAMLTATEQMHPLVALGCH